MKEQLSDQDVLDLLNTLKNSEDSYPSDMIRSRRNSYLRQAAAMTVLTSPGGHATPPTVPATAGGGFSLGSLLEAALVIALVVETAVIAYIYRDRIADFIDSTLSPQVEVVTNPSGDSPLDDPTGKATIMPASPGITATAPATPTPTATVTVTVTKSPAPTVTSLPAVDGDSSSSNGTGDTQVISTPRPDNENPGLHLGQTKQPTQDPNSDKKNDNAPADRDKNNTDTNTNGKDKK